ncbi:MAG: hypothetical protein J6C86_01710 [Bacteroidaceae bacterium]|nr:hypothetical protein [Bacteroidaceae bacterium]
MSFEDYSVFDKMIVEVGGFDSYLFVLYPNTIFLILSNVKIPSPLARVKMKRTELSSKNGASTRIF